MITTALLTIFYTVFNFFLGLLPTGHINTSITNAINWFFYSAHSFDFIIPVGTIIQVLIWGVVFEASILLYKIILMLLNKIRGV